MSVNECFSAIFFARRVETAWRNLEQSLFSLVVLMNTMINSFWLVCEIFFSLVFESSAERRTRGFDRSVLLARGTTLLGLLRQQDGVNVRQDAARRDGDGAQELGQFLVVTDRELNVTRHDARLFVVSARVTGQFEDFRGEVLEHGGQVDRRAGAHARGVLASLQVTGDATDGELQASLGGSAHGLLARLSFSSARHL